MHIFSSLRFKENEMKEGYRGGQYYEPGKEQHANY